MKSFFIKIALQDQRVDDFEKILEDLKKYDKEVEVYRVPARTGNHSLIKLVMKRPNGERFEYQALHRLTDDGYVTFVDANYSGFAVDERSIRENAGIGPIGFFSTAYFTLFHFASE